MKLPKQLFMIIRQAFQYAGIKTPETELTDAELSDALYNYNCMIASWNNDGFRMFKIKYGNLPLLPGKLDYKFSEDAYRHVANANLLEAQMVGATRIIVRGGVANAAPGQYFTTESRLGISESRITHANFDRNELVINSPYPEGIAESENVFYGDFALTQTPVTTVDVATQNYINISGLALPSVGDQIMFELNSSWQKRTVTTVNGSTRNVAFDGNELGEGDQITNPQVLFGSNPNAGLAERNYPLTLRRVILDKDMDNRLESIALLGNDDPHLNSVIEIERWENSRSAILREALNEGFRQRLGSGFMNANQTQPGRQLYTIKDFASYEGYQIGSYARGPNFEAITLENRASDGELVETVVLRRVGAGAWTDIGYDDALGAKLKMALGRVFLLPQDPLDSEPLFMREITINTQDQLSQSMPGGFEDIFTFQGWWYATAYWFDDATMMRQISSTRDFSGWAPTWTIVQDGMENPCEFQGRLYVGKYRTWVTSDMRSFVAVPAYSESRIILGEKMLNINSEQFCSYTENGRDFVQLPFLIANKSAWNSFADCAIAAMFDFVAQDGYSQIFLANSIAGPFVNQFGIMGIVKDIMILGDQAILVSGQQIWQMQLNNGLIAQPDRRVFLFGEKCLRPQEIIDGKKFSFLTQMELPMTQVALKDYNLLPSINVEGDPVSFMFLRESEDGLIKVWGRPRAFGEFIRFTYVEPLIITDDPTRITELPDEYVSPAIAGLAVELGMQYHVPAQRIQVLTANFQDEMDKAQLHDNEDTSILMQPGRRSLQPRG